MTFINNLDFTSVLTGIGLTVAVLWIVPPLIGLLKPSPKDSDSDITSDNLSTALQKQENIPTSFDNMMRILAEAENRADDDSIASDNEYTAAENQPSAAEILDYDPFFVDLSPVFHFDLVTHQIVAVDFIMRYVTYLDKPSRDMIREWWNTTMTMSLDPKSVLMMSDILQQFNILMSQL